MSMISRAPSSVRSMARRSWTSAVAPSPLLATTDAAALADALGGLGACLFLVDASGKIAYANAAGHGMLGERSVVREVEGRLVACEAHAARALKQTLARYGSGETAPGLTTAVVPLSARDGSHYIAHVVPLASDLRRRVGASCMAVATLIVHKAALEAPCAPEAIASLYNLTPTELRVLLAIVEVGGVPETAEVLGVAQATVKTHLHRVFGKTGTARQADLVKLVAAFSTPLIARPMQPARAGIRSANAGLLRERHSGAAGCRRSAGTTTKAQGSPVRERGDDHAPELARFPAL